MSNSNKEGFIISNKTK